MTTSVYTLKGEVPVTVTCEMPDTDLRNAFRNGHDLVVCCAIPVHAA